MVTLSNNIKRVVTIFILRPNKLPRPEASPSHQSNQKYHSKNDFDIGVFRRCATMPTFPNHWAGISGSIEENDASPLDAALRELREETNVEDLFQEYCRRGKSHASMVVSGSGSGNGRCVGGDEVNENCVLGSHVTSGLYVDLMAKSSRDVFGGRTIRVYPFALTLPDAELKNHDGRNLWSEIAMKGTEHDEMKFLTLDGFFDLTPCVPDLKLAFHHATFGAYLDLPDEVRTWGTDRINGAASLARQAVSLAAAYSDETCSSGGETVANPDIQNHIKKNQPSVALSIAMLRPTMVPIVNVMKKFEERMQLDQKKQDIENDLLHSLSSDALKCVELGVDAVMNSYNEWESKQQHQTEIEGISKDFVIGTFSRSSTLKLILEQFKQKLEEIRINRHNPSEAALNIRITCSQSTPGDEGELMAADIPDASWLTDDDFENEVRNGRISIVIVGADCIPNEGRGVVNKVGTAVLASICKRSKVPIICCADKWKLWDDIYPPPLEDIFELVPADLFDKVLVPSN